MVKNKGAKDKTKRSRRKETDQERQTKRARKARVSQQQSQLEKANFIVKMKPRAETEGEPTASQPPAENSEAPTGRIYWPSSGAESPPTTAMPPEEEQGEAAPSSTATAAPASTTAPPAEAPTTASPSVPPSDPPRTAPTAEAQAIDFMECDGYTDIGSVAATVDDTSTEGDSKEEGVMFGYLLAMMNRFRTEQSSDFHSKKGGGSTWLTDYLQQHGWWIRREYAKTLCTKLKIPFSQNEYYRDV